MTKNLEHLLTLSCNIKHKNVDMSGSKIGWIYKLDDIFHLGHIIPLITLSKFVKEGSSLHILLEDSDYSIKVNKETVEKKFKFMGMLIFNIFKILNVDVSKIQIYRSSELRDKSQYVMDFYKLVSIISEKESLIALNKKDVCKMGDLLFPVLRMLDASYLDVDYIVTGINHSLIYELADKKLSELGFRKVKVILHECIDGLKGNKMSKYDSMNKISIIDTKKSLEKKINKVFCEEGNKNNILMGIYKLIIFPYFSFESKLVEIIDIADKRAVYRKYEDLEGDFVEKKIYPGDLKSNCSRCLNHILQFFKEKIKENEKDIKTIFNIK